MNNHLTNIQEVLNELAIIKDNLVWYNVYNNTVKVQLCTLYRKKYQLIGKPKVYTFSDLNLQKQFVNMLSNCKLQKVK